MGVYDTLMLENIFIIVVLIMVAGAGVVRIRRLNTRPLPSEPIADALLGISDLEQHARELATRQRVSGQIFSKGRLLPDPRGASRVLKNAYTEMSEAVRAGYSPSPAGEWLMDNFYVINGSIQDIQGSMPAGYYRELPKLTNGRLQGYPRVYALALDLISHTDGHIDTDTLERFFAAYQSIAPLSMGEVWAIPTFIRIGLTENLKYLSLQVIHTQRQRQKASKWLDSLLQRARSRAVNLEDLIQVRTRWLRRVNATFATELLYRLRNEGADAAPLSDWLDRRLAAIGTTADEIVHLEHQRQSAREISVRNAINSLRGLAAIDWSESFERLSYVERILQTDPDGTYAAMDTASRDVYRHRIEKIARSMDISELQVVRQAIQCARDVPTDSVEFWKRHVGYYLLEGGREELLARLGKPMGLWYLLIKGLKERRFGLYLAAIGLFTLIIVVGFYVGIGYRGSFSSFLWLVILTLLASEIAVRVVNGFITMLIPPRILPKLELRHGIPEEHTTMVVIPALLPNQQRTLQLIDALEVYYLANQESNLCFALLADFADAPDQILPSDGEILDVAQRRIQELNEQYTEDHPVFYFFHRERLWNNSENCHMGWERKRGKLEEFNRLLRGAKDTTYVVDELPQCLTKVRYVITLDADTGLPRDAARRLIGVLIHPLNRPVVAKSRGRVIRGYGLLQPRINIVATSAARSLFTRVFAGDGGVDPYTTAVSDVYQDLFGEGIYTGKGIYDVDVFNAVLGQRLPENAILSHDLLEGSYIRAGLATDIELVDGYPARYDAYALRLHRWVRGDWQLVPWLFPKVPFAQGKEPNPLSALSRWKIADNLRRSLIAPALLFVIIGGLAIFFGSPGPYLGLALLVILLPWLTLIVSGTLGSPQGKRFLGHVFTMVSNSRKQAWQVVLSLAFLPYQSYLMIDAAMRTLIRVFYTRSRLLEWVTAADVEERLPQGWRAYWIRMWPGQIVALVSLGLVGYLRPANLYWASPILLLWLASPWIAYQVSRPIGDTVIELAEGDRQQLRIYARRIWRYFEDFVEAKDNWLPPDHYQESPRLSVAHRTSPTNIGLYLLSILGAWDLGYIGMGAVIKRVEDTLSTIKKLETWHGHLHNWYDTKSLRPLRPFYISTVDSGNFVGYLMALRQGLLDMLTEPLMDLGRWQAGLADTLALMSLEVRGNNNRPQPGEVTVEFSAESELDHRSDSRQSPLVIRGIAALGNLEEKLNHIIMVEKSQKETSRSRQSWALRLSEMITSYQQEIETVYPWTPLFKDVPSILKNGSLPVEAKNLWHSVLTTLNGSVSLLDLPDVYSGMDHDIRRLVAFIAPSQEVVEDVAIALVWLEDLTAAIAQSKETAKSWVQEFYGLADRLQGLIAATEFRHLYDEKRHMFSIGYSLEEERLTHSYYDLLASEARQASFVAIAKGDIPQKHWFKLGRTMIHAGDSRTLISWSGTMFEYLMPLLIMETYPGTLLAEALAAAVREQINYGRHQRVPWGISECGFSALNVQLNYQYQAFGVPTLGLKRGLVRDLVIAPYATFLALMVSPVESYQNLQALAEKGLVGTYGMYEAIDFTPDRVPRNIDGSIVKMYMAHHLGMSFLAINNYLFHGVMRRRFHNDPYVQATDLLLQERLPRYVVPMTPQADTAPVEEPARQGGPLITRRFAMCDLDERDVFLASNGAYSIMVTTTGSGYSQWEDISITRWRRDITLDRWGTFFYIKDLKKNRIWSATYEPTKVVPDVYEVEFADDRAEFLRWDDNLKTRMEITVSSEQNAEIRRISLTNHGTESRLIEVTSFFEVVADRRAADLAHPAFGNLFVQTELIPDCDALLAHRRPRHENQEALWVVHTVSVEGNTVGDLEYETDRARFIGRGTDLSRPESLDRRLSGRVGAVLDPCMSLRRRVRILPGKTVRIVYSTALARSRSEAIALAKGYHEPDGANRDFALAWARSQVELRYLNLSLTEAHLFQSIATRLIYGYPLEASQRSIAVRNRLGQPSLWALGISGDMPILLVKIKSQKEREIVRQALVAHEYWRMKGLPVDLVVLNQEAAGYEQAVHDLLRQLLASGHAQAKENRPGGIFLKQVTQLAPMEQDLLEAAARVVIGNGQGSLGEKARNRPHRLVAVSRRGLLARRRPPEPTISLGDGESLDGSWEPSTLDALVNDANPDDVELARTMSRLLPAELDGGHGRPTDLVFFNTLGGFSPDGREYTILLRQGVTTPAPWINVVSNPAIGFLISESGAGYTWTENSRENKLTPWSNDPVIDPPGEALYLKDEKSEDIWSPTASPILEPEEYIVSHGQGYSRFCHTSHGLEQTLWVFVPLKDPVKIYRLKLKNLGPDTRHLTTSFYAELTLGVHREITQQQIVTGVDSATKTIVARSSFRDDVYRERVAFLATSLPGFSFTGDRRELIGFDGSLASPKGLKGKNLSGNVGSGFDPCMAIMAPLELEPGDEVEIVFLLGEVANTSDVETMVGRYGDPLLARSALEEVQGWWDETLRSVEISTPNQALDILVNRWLLYQNLACRVWGRSAFYQAGGAYGYRDQLQDVMALLVSRPSIARAHILRAAAHQYVEGDVQHWWHPDSNKGIRTRFADDLLWLPFVTAKYVEVTGDTSIWEEEVGFLEDDPLGPDEQERYGTPRQSSQKASIIQHCWRAIERSLRFGEHGLPLMGSGDWNDGMNRVGWQGSGESVWMGWFLYTILIKFAPITETKGDDERASRYLREAKRLAHALYHSAWDGEWYRRAYFDDGTPLGSANNEECKIDSIAQSWAVISGAADPERAREAMRAVGDYLVRKEDGMILLLAPPFDRMLPDPGYIRSYVPGVRENGGQYTHAAMWVIMATAMLGEGERAMELMDLVNPIYHALDLASAWQYRVEPYVVAADVAAVAPNVGRGGWTWYTGAAGWMYQVAVEWLLGLKVSGDHFVVEPCVPRTWPEFTMKYRYKTTTYEIKVLNPDRVETGVLEIRLNGARQGAKGIPLVDSGSTHYVIVQMGTGDTKTIQGEPNDLISVTE